MVCWRFRSAIKPRWFPTPVLPSQQLRKRILSGFCTLFVVIGLESCGPPAQQPVTLTLLDSRWLDKEFNDWRDQELEQFTRETGIKVTLLPGPEAAIEQLALLRKLLDGGSSTPDVYSIDVIWPGMLAEYFLDLKSALAQEASSHFPALVANDTVNGKLVAMPYHADAGLLFYRTDLLRQYGYRAPPKTWDELETMAARIQGGERVKGKKDFWGFVWEGAPSEALTCNALEWQASEGGGRIIEEDKTITVNNPQATRTWARAAHWRRTISPPGVTAYKEWDAVNIWRSGNAAFMRNWTAAYSVSRSQESAVRNNFGVTLPPGGREGHASTFGGQSLSVSRHSAHPQEAIALVRYLCRRDVQLRRARATFQAPTIPELYEDPELQRFNPYFAQLKQGFLEEAVARPSTVTGKKYGDVSEAYFSAVHSVLTGEKNAAKAAADLEGELVQITGFKIRTPVSTRLLMPNRGPRGPLREGRNLRGATGGN
jgi:trehalose/maltose transport system substrate-binding protein